MKKLTFYGDTEKVAEIMRNLILFGVWDIRLIKLFDEVSRYRREVIPYIAYRIACECIHFYPDTKKQTIRTAYRVLKEKKGNCVDVAVLIGTILKHFNFPVKIRRVDVHGKGFDHVFIVCGDTWIDPNYYMEGKKKINQGFNFKRNFYKFDDIKV